MRLAFGFPIPRLRDGEGWQWGYGSGRGLHRPSHAVAPGLGTGWWCRDSKPNIS